MCLILERRRRLLWSNNERMPLLFVLYICVLFCTLFWSIIKQKPVLNWILYCLLFLYFIEARPFTYFARNISFFDRILLWLFISLVCFNDLAEFYRDSQNLKNYWIWIHYYLFFTIVVKIDLLVIKSSICL